MVIFFVQNMVPIDFEILFKSGLPNKSIHFVKLDIVFAIIFEDHHIYPFVSLSSLKWGRKKTKIKE